VRDLIPLLERMSLFHGISSPQELDELLSCLGASWKKVTKGDFVLLTGDKPTHVGIVVSGELQVVREDYHGRRSLLSLLTRGDTYGEALCSAGVKESPVTVIASTDASLVNISFDRVLFNCPKNCSYHSRLIANMLHIIATKNLLLQKRMEILSLKTIRERLTVYLDSFAPKVGQELVIPLNREELADYLGVERSALSHELAKMKSDRLLEYRKNHFTLLQ